MIPSGQELDDVLSGYVGIEDYSLTPIKGGTANKNYLIRAGQDRYVLRMRNPRYSNEEWVRYESEYLHSMSAKGFPVPVPILNKSGKSWSMHAGNVYQLYPYLEGQPCDPDNETEILEAGAFLARLHSASVGFQTSAAKDWPRFDDPLVILTALEKVSEEQRSCIGADEQATLQYVEHSTRQLLERIPDGKYHCLPKTVVHGDFHPANVKYSEHRLCGLFDFDWICVQPRMRDVVDGIIYFTGIRSASIEGESIYSLTQGCTFEIGRSMPFIQSYYRNSDPVLTSDELDTLPWLMRGRLIHSRVQALPKIPPDRHVEMLTRDIEIPLRWLDEHQEKMVRFMKESCKL